MISALIAGAVSFAFSLLKWVWEGFINVITHPVTLTIVAIAWLHGDWHGHHVGAAQVTLLKHHIKAVDHAEKLRAQAAIAAGELEAQKPSPFSVSPAAAPAPATAAVPAVKPAGVRKPTGRHQAQSVFSVLGLE